MGFLDVFSQPWFGNGLAVLGVGLAFYFYKRSTPLPRISYQSSSVTVVGTPEAAFKDSVSIYFSGSKVPRVTATELYLWNSGNTTLDHNQSIPADQLRLTITNGEILIVERRAVTRQVNSFRAQISDAKRSEAVIYFDYLDPRDGAALYLLHTGTRNAISVVGTLKGMKRAPKKHRGAIPSHSQTPKRLRTLNKVRDLTMIFAAVVGIGAIVAGTLRLLDPNFLKPASSPLSEQLIGPPWLSGVAPVVLGLLYVVPPAIYWILRMRRFPAALLQETVAQEGISDDGASPTAPVFPSNEEAFQVGEVVLHDKFGDGQILSVSDDIAVVEFDQHGRKKMLLSFLSKPS